MSKIIAQHKWNKFQQPNVLMAPTSSLRFDSTIEAGQLVTCGWRRAPGPRCRGPRRSRANRTVCSGLACPCCRCWAGSPTLAASDSWCAGSTKCRRSATETDKRCRVSSPAPLPRSAILHANTFIVYISQIINLEIQ